MSDNEKQGSMRGDVNSSRQNARSPCCDRRVLFTCPSATRAVEAVLRPFDVPGVRASCSCCGKWVDLNQIKYVDKYRGFPVERPRSL